MNSYRRNERTPLFSVVIFVLALVGILFGVDYLTRGALREQVRSVSGAAMSTTASAASAIGSSGFFSSNRALQTENEELRRDLSLAAEMLASVERLQGENETLRALAGLAADLPGKTARIISSFQTTPYGTFMIDVGRDGGIGEGFLVLTEGGYVLGTIADVHASTATVRTVFSPGQDVDLVVGDAAFVAKGQGGGNAEAEVPREALMRVGDSARAPLFANRPAGIVGSVSSASSSATQSVHIRVPANLDTLQFVYVVSR